MSRIGRLQDEATRLMEEAAMFSLAMGGDGSDISVEPPSFIHGDDEDDDDYIVSSDSDEVSDYYEPPSSPGVQTNARYVRMKVDDKADRYFPVPGYEVEVSLATEYIDGTGLLVKDAYQSEQTSGLRAFYKSVDVEKAAKKNVLQKSVPRLPISKRKRGGKKNAAATAKRGKKSEEKIRTPVNLYSGAGDPTKHVAIVLRDICTCGIAQVTVNEEGIHTIHRSTFIVYPDNLSKREMVKDAMDHPKDEENPIFAESDEEDYVLQKGLSILHLTATMSEILFVIEDDTGAHFLYSWKWKWIHHSITAQSNPHSESPVLHPRSSALGIQNKKILSMKSSRSRTFIWCEDGSLCTFVDQRVIDVLAIQVNGDAHACSQMLHRLEFTCTKFQFLNNLKIHSIAMNDDTLSVVTKEGRVFFWKLREIGGTTADDDKTTLASVASSPIIKSSVLNISTSWTSNTPVGGSGSSSSSSSSAPSSSPSSSSSSSSSSTFQKGQYVSSKISLGGAIVMMKSSAPALTSKGKFNLASIGYPQVGKVVTNENGFLKVISYANDDLRKIVYTKTCGGSDKRIVDKFLSSFSKPREIPVGPTIPVPQIQSSSAISYQELRSIVNVKDDMWPADECYVLKPPPHLGRIVSIDGPFVVVDISSDESNEPTLKVFMSKDVQLAAPLPNISSTSANSITSPSFIARRQNYHQHVWSEIIVKQEDLSGPREETKQFDGQHPYENNMDTSKLVSFPGAEKLVVTFNSRTVTESGCDYLTFGKVGTENEYWGARRYSGSSGPSNWPGVSGSPPLEILSDRFELKFHSDGSCTYWGWQFTVKAHYPSSSNGTSAQPKHAHALASRITNNGRIQILWNRDHTLKRDRCKLSKKSFKEPSI